MTTPEEGGSSGSSKQQQALIPRAFHDETGQLGGVVPRPPGHEVQEEHKDQPSSQPKAVQRELVKKLRANRCMSCRKRGHASLVRPCACPSKYLHEACLVAHTIRTLDRPCPFCGRLAHGSHLLGRRTLNVHTDPAIMARNESLFRALIVSLLVAQLALRWLRPWLGLGTGDYTTGKSTIAQTGSGPPGWLITLPISTLALAIVMYALFQRYLNAPATALYFSDRTRILSLRDPLTRRPLHLYSRSLYGLLVDPATGHSRLLNRHVADTAPKWRLHRLMAP